MADRRWVRALMGRPEERGQRAEARGQSKEVGRRSDRAALCPLPSYLCPLSSDLFTLTFVLVLRAGQSRYARWHSTQLAFIRRTAARSAGGSLARAALSRSREEACSSLV